MVSLSNDSVRPLCLSKPLSRVMINVMRNVQKDVEALLDVRLSIVV